MSRLRMTLGPGPVGPAGRAGLSATPLSVAETAVVGQGKWLGIALIMLIPILMVVLALTLPFPVVAWPRRRG